MLDAINYTEVVTAASDANNHITTQRAVPGSWDREPKWFLSRPMSVPDYPRGKRGKCHGPRALKGPQRVEKHFARALNIQRCYLAYAELMISLVVVPGTAAIRRHR